MVQSVSQVKVNIPKSTVAVVTCSLIILSHRFGTLKSFNRAPACQSQVSIICGHGIRDTNKEAHTSNTVCTSNSYKHKIYSSENFTALLT